MPGLAFLSPMFLAGLAAVAIPLALHLFFRRAEPVVEFSAMRYLRKAPVEQAARRRLREWLLLALRCAALVLLALAFARPYFVQAAAALSAPATLVMVDTSVSLSAPGQMARARALAEEAINRAAPAEAVGVMAFGATVDVVAPVATDRAAALEAVASLKPTGGATRYRTALSRAAEALGDRRGTIVVVTDLQESGWDAGEEGGVPERVKVLVSAVPSPAANAAVTALRVDGSDAVAVVQAFASGPSSYQVTFAIDGQRFAAVPVAPVPGGTAEARVRLGPRDRGALSATIDDRQGYDGDNTRYAVLDAASVPSVLLVTTSGSDADAFFAARAIAVGEGGSVFRSRRTSGRQFSDLTGQALSDVDVIVLLGTRGIEHQGRERLASFLRNGGGVLVAAGPDVDPAVVKEALNGVAATTWRERGGTSLRFLPEDHRHPIFRPFGGVGALSGATFSRASLMAPARDAAVLARYTDGSPALVEEAAGAGRVLFFASDLNNRWNDLPVQPSFVPFLHETLRYLAAGRGGPSEYLVGDLPGAPGLAPGVVRPGGGSGRRVAVNVDVRESDPSRMTPETFYASVARLHARGAEQATAGIREREDTHRLWQYGLLLMVVSLAAEGMVGRRLG